MTATMTRAIIMTATAAIKETTVAAKHAVKVGPREEQAEPT